MVVLHLRCQETRVESVPREETDGDQEQCDAVLPLRCDTLRVEKG